MVQSRKFRGVRQRHWGSWVSEIRHPLLKRRVWLGTFDTAEEAAKVYDEAAILMSGRNAKTNFALAQNSVLSKGISEILHAKLKKSSKTPSPSLTCLRLDTENSHIGVWQKSAGVCSDSNWIMRVELDHHIYNSPAQEELVLMNTSCSSSSPSSSTSATTDEEHSLALEMIQELLNPNYIN